MNEPGDTVPVPGWSMGGRGQETTVPHPNARHILRMRTISDHEHVDHYLTADEALKARVRRLKEQGYKYTIHGHTVTYTDTNGDFVALEYLTPTKEVDTSSGRVNKTPDSLQETLL